MRSSLSGFSDLYRAVSTDIFKFCRVMNFTPTDYQQANLLEAVMKAELGLGPRRIAVKSGQGPGKTTASVLATLWRVFIHVGALAVVTAPTMRQLREIWLAEVRARIKAADPIIQKLFNVTKSKIEIGGDPDWGVKLVTATKEENAQGYHQANMTVVAEEASGISREIVTQFKGTLSNPNALFLMIGNPNTRDCSFFDCFHSQRHQWECMTWNAEETAEKSPWLLDPQRNKDLEEEFGRDSDVYRVRVLGEFPLSDPNCVMSSEDLEKVCLNDDDWILKHAQGHRIAKFGGGIAKQFGIDLARFGGDESTIFRRLGNSIMEWTKFAHKDPSDVLDYAFKMQHLASWRNEETQFVADAGGMGQGIMHRFYHAHKRVLEFHNNGVALESHIYDNKITEAWFHLAQKVKELGCALPKDNILIQQLCTRQYNMTKKGKIQLETKDEFMRRGFESPDRADGCVMAMYDPVQATGYVTTRSSGDHTPGHIKIRSAAS